MTAARRRVLLASASPRRRDLLVAAGCDVEVCAPNVDESWPPGGVEEGVVELARRKLAAVGPQRWPVIAADTVVVLDEDRLGKPTDEADARRMLGRLSGRSHRVLTGYCVRHRAAERNGFVATDVRFRRLSEVEIDAYVRGSEPYDKAGGYAIQGVAGAFVESVQGSYTNVVGLPLTEVLAAVEAVG